jgi:hypothetical protein
MSSTPCLAPSAGLHRHLDLLNADGTISAEAVMRRAHRNAHYERDLVLCTANGVLTPLAIPLGDVAAWRAARAKTLPYETAPPYGAFLAAELGRAWSHARELARTQPSCRTPIPSALTGKPRLPLPRRPKRFRNGHACTRPRAQ